MRRLKLSMIVGLMAVTILLAGCRGASTLPAGTPVSTIQTTAAVPTAPVNQPTQTSMPAPLPETLVVCTQDEPKSLYLYGSSSRSMWSVLEAVYDGPFDTRGFAAQPVILEKIPSLADGDAVIKPVTLQEGDTVVDAKGNLVALKAGTEIYPSGCTSPDCAVAWDGVSPISADQLVVTFQLKDGLKWSDGQPLTANDSLFSYALASDPKTPASKYLTDRTFSYRSPDSRTIEWTGMPGFYEQRFGTFFWLPQPEHVFGTKSAEAILNDPAAARAPLGWGPYVIDEWVDGDHITLRKNENYFRAGEGLPYFDTLVFRFIGQAADGNMNALLAGECDVVDQNMQFLEMLPDLLTREAENKLKTYVGQGPEWEHLDFGIRPAAYDDGYQAEAGDRPDLFGDERVRRALAACIDRQSIIDQFLYGRSDLPNSYLPPSHPLYVADLQQQNYDPNLGMQLLDEAGWKDADNNPATPRTAAGISGIPDGTVLSMNYLTSEAPLRIKVSEAAAGMLAGCGIQVNVQHLNPGSLYAPGPDGPVFGRKFDLAQFSWEAGPRPNCLLYSFEQVPTAENQWTGANITGMNSPEYDAACSAAYWARPVDADYADRNRKAQEQFNQDIPAVPLYFYPKIAIARADLCGLEMDVTARSLFWNIESLNYGQGCQK
jgi:peptide/nickel transport system substrate-binding protein